MTAKIPTKAILIVMLPVVALTATFSIGTTVLFYSQNLDKAASGINMAMDSWPGPLCLTYWQYYFSSFLYHSTKTVTKSYGRFYCS